MPNFTVSTDVDSFMQGADFAAMRTSLGVKSETDTEAADNRRAFSGGLALSSGNNLVTNEIPFQNQGAFTFGGNFSFNSGTSAGIFGIHSSSGRGFNSDMLIRCRADNSNIYFFYYNGTSNFRRAVASHSHEGNVTNLLITFDGTSAPSIIVNGEPKTLSESTSGATPPNWSDPISGDFFIYGQAQSNDLQAATLSDVAILNTALTSAQAAEIYRDGLQPWLAANPEYRKSEDRYFSDYSAGLDGGTASNVIATGDNDGVTDGTTSYNDVLKVVANTANNQKSFAFPIATKVRANEPDVFSFKFKYFIPSGTNITDIRWFIANSGILSFFGGSPSFSDTGTWVQVERVGTITSGANPNAALRLYLNNASGFAGDGVNDIVYIRDVELVKVGALANLPLDDDSRQLKDISGNRNDATASEAGVNHLIQKDTHSFRDDHADGTGGSYLIANADILAENEVITGVTMDGRFYAATEAQDLTKRRIKLVTSGSHIEVKRSDGTIDDASNATTHPASTTDFAVNVLTQRI